MAVSIRVSDFDITKGQTRYNESTKPFPRIVGGQPTWQIAAPVGDEPTKLTHSVVTAANLLSVTGVTPRRSGNNYAVTRVTSAPTGGNVAVSHNPRLDYITANPFQSLTFSKWVYVKRASAGNDIYGFGYSTWDSSFVETGGAGDSYEGLFPANQWTQVSYQVQLSAPPNVMFYNVVLPTSHTNMAVGDVVISTDFLVSYSGSTEYFDGDFSDVGDTSYGWEDVTYASRSIKSTVIPSSVLIFPPDNIIDYSVSEEAMSLDPGDFQGGYGSITFNIDDGPDVRLLGGRTFALEDGDKGKVSGTVTGMEGGQDGVSVTTDSALGVLNSWQRIEPYNGDFQGYITYLLSLVNLTNPVIYDNNEIPAKDVVARGYIGNLWDWIKQLLSVYQVEMSLVYNDIVFRPYRTYEAYTGRQSESSWSISSGESAKAVEITYYSNEYNFGEVYPLSYDDDDEDSVIMQVDSGETVEYVLQLNSTPTNFDEYLVPAVDYVTNGPQISSRYAVVGADELPVMAAQWEDAGGSLKVRPSDTDPTQIIVTVKGADIRKLAPFRIAMSSGAGNYYNSLHLVMNAVHFSPQTVRIDTGASRDTTGTDVGVVVQNTHISTRGQAFDLGVRTAARYAGTTYSVSGTAWDINRAGYTGGVYPQISNFNDSFAPGSTVATFNNRYPGVVIGEFNAQWDSTILNIYAVQAFGNAAGARVRDAEAFFRIDSATFSPTTMDYFATIDTVIDDFNTVWDGMTVDDFNETHYERMIRDFSMIPLRKPE